MKRWASWVFTLAALCISTVATSAQTKSSVDKLYILNCGECVAGDISCWSPGVNFGKSMDFVDNCYLMHHTRGWLLWDTGVTNAIAAMPDGQAPADPRMTHWRRPKTLASQLEMLGVKPADITYLAVFHTHPDQIILRCSLAVNAVPTPTFVFFMAMLAIAWSADRPCGMAPSDWCPSPPNDPCGRHHTSPPAERIHPVTACLIVGVSACLLP